jgi:lauroyl/myristoyl acyltransferase
MSLYLPWHRPAQALPLLPGELVNVRGPLDAETLVRKLEVPITKLRGGLPGSSRALARAIVRNLEGWCNDRGHVDVPSATLDFVDRLGGASPPIVAAVLGPYVLAMIRELESRGVRCIASRTPVVSSLFAAAHCSAQLVNLPDMPRAVRGQRGEPTVVFTFPDHQWSGMDCAIRVRSFGTNLLWGVHEAVLLQTTCFSGLYFLGVGEGRGAPTLLMKPFVASTTGSRAADLVSWLATSVEALAEAVPEEVFSWWWLAWRELTRAEQRRIGWARLETSLDLLSRLQSVSGQEEQAWLSAARLRRPASGKPNDDVAARSAPLQRQPRSLRLFTALAPTLWRRHALDCTVKNLAQVYGAEGPAHLMARAHCAHQALLGLEHQLLISLPVSLVTSCVLRRVRFEPAGVEQMLSSGARGVLLLTPHFGSFAVGALALAARVPHDRELAFFYEDPGNNPAVAYFDRLFARVFPRVKKLRPTLSGLRAALRVLSEGGIVCLMPDVYKLQEGVFFVPFMGQLCPFMGGAAYLWQRSGACVVVGACLRTKGWQWSARLEALAQLPGGPRLEGDQETELYARTALIARAIEGIIHDAPPLWAYWSSLDKRAVPWDGAGAGRGAWVGGRPVPVTVTSISRE